MIARGAAGQKMTWSFRKLESCACPRRDAANDENPGIGTDKSPRAMVARRLTDTIATSVPSMIALTTSLGFASFAATRGSCFSVFASQR
jgi:hypothetical protein